jgi:hypothetical protein
MRQIKLQRCLNTRSLSDYCYGMDDTNASTASPDSADPSLQYQHASGSGFAAILLFLHIALAGYLAYLTVFLIRHYADRVFFNPNVSWQYLFPALFAACSYLPSDRLTRTVAGVARWAGLGSLCIFFLLVVVLITFHFRQTAPLSQIVSPAAKGLGALLVTLVANTFAAAGPALLAAEMFRSGIGSRLSAEHSRALWPLSFLPSLARGILSAALAAGWLAALMKTDIQPAVIAATACAGAILLIGRLFLPRQAAESE